MTTTIQTVNIYSNYIISNNKVWVQVHDEVVCDGECETCDVLFYTQVNVACVADHLETGTQKIRSPPA